MPNKECCQGTDNPVGALCRDCPHSKPRPSLDILNPTDIAARLKETGRFDKDEPWPGWNGGKKLIEKDPPQVVDDPQPENDMNVRSFLGMDFSKIEAAILGHLGVTAEEFAAMSEEEKRKLGQEKFFGGSFAVGGPVTGRWAGGRMGELAHSMNMRPVFTTSDLPAYSLVGRMPWDRSKRDPHVIYVKSSQVGLVDNMIQDMLAKKSRATHVQFPLMKPVRVNVQGSDPDPQRLLDTWGHNKLEHIATFALFSTFGFDPAHMPKFDAVGCDVDYTRVTAHWTDMVPIVHDEVRAMHNTLFIPATGHAIWQREPE